METKLASAEAEASKDGGKIYAVNTKLGGRVHRLTQSSAQLPLDKKRARCGWRAGSSVALAAFCKRAALGKLCRKCFREAALRRAGEEEDDVISQYA